VQRSGWSTPFVWKTPGRTEIVAVGPEVVVSYDLAGEELWRLAGLSGTPVTTPFAYEGLLYNQRRTRSVVVRDSSRALRETFR
jgi:hypothetical protein